MKEEPTRAARSRAQLGLLVLFVASVLGAGARKRGAVSDVAPGGGEITIRTSK